MDNLDENIGNFVAITGSTAEQARFFLESSGGDLSTAMDSYFESNGGIEEEEEPELPMSAPPRATPTQQTMQAPQSSARPPSARTRKAPGNIRSFSDLRGAEGDSDDDDDGPNEYYTGGEKSGMMVQDPNSRKTGGDDIEALFEKARQHGATTGTAEDLNPARNRNAAFGGVGRTLAGTPIEQAQAPVPDDSGTPEPVIHTVTFYNNGFTVDDGPLRKQDDPANKPFMKSIEDGECPRELEPAQRNIPVHVNLVRKAEDYTPPPVPRYVAFSGSGRTLGASSPAPSPTSTSAPAHVPTPTAQSSKDFNVDESQPVTSLQLRLHDGTRMVAKFNHSHTVQDIRNFVSHARPSAPSNFKLMMSFPTKELTNLNETIAEAGLVGAVIMQQL
eukprot:CAMPEP_0196586396 /NCGR_PEP_ID=MMETSP1081-20130531/54102_1 /TAXON_ID=36882 /ORGANISM="Pyramimonas amylifera, Strain CCMP720" /LENGTH=387 /DNA_ID=CAMNT_0041908261 /DNA_START=35 /DNA_END=1198 /DNA_ORIENTATION=+